MLSSSFVKVFTRHAEELEANYKALGNLHGLWQAKKAKSRPLQKLISALAQNVKVMKDDLKKASSAS